MAAPNLIIAGINLPQLARLEFSQTFERVDGGATSRRMAAGGLFTMEHWERWKTTISGGGWVPAPLLSIRRGIAFELHSIAPIALKPGEDLPAGWSERADWPGTSITDPDGIEIRLVYPVMTVCSAAGARLIIGGNSPQWEMVCEQP